MQTETWIDIRIHKIATGKYFNTCAMHESHDFNSFFQKQFSIFGNRINISLPHYIIPLVPELPWNIFKTIVYRQFIGGFYAAERDNKSGAKPCTIMNEPFK